jgi:hypothetical protein
MYVYLSGPITHNPKKTFFRISEAGKIHCELMRRGFFPFTPHLLSLADMIDGGIGYEDWMNYDLAWILKCDLLIRLPGESTGADREVGYAKAHNIAVVSWEKFCEENGIERTKGKDGVAGKPGVEEGGRSVDDRLLPRRGDAEPGNKNTRGKGLVQKRTRGGK